MSTMATVTARIFAVSAGRQSSDTTRRAVTPAGDTTSKSSQSISTTTRRTKIPRRAALLTGVPLGCILARASSTPLPADAAGIDPVSTLTRRGMAKFVQDDVDGSIADFDLVIQSSPRMEPYMWQRGLSLYYAERFVEGSEQFRKDVKVNPNDTEEAIWAFLCDARDPSIGFTGAGERLMKTGVDGRRYMRAAYDLFAGEGAEGGADPEAQLARVAELGPADEFYSLLYRGLYREAKGDADGAKAFMTEAAKSSYGAGSGDYMAALAKVHCKRRGWAV